MSNTTSDIPPFSFFFFRLPISQFRGNIGHHERRDWMGKIRRSSGSLTAPLSVRAAPATCNLPLHNIYRQMQPVSQLRFHQVTIFARSDHKVYIITNALNKRRKYMSFPELYCW